MPVGMHALFVRPVGAEGPFRVKGMLDAGAAMQGIRRPVMRINQGSRAPGGNAARVSRRDAGLRSRVYGLKRGHPAVLCQVIVIETDAGANHSVSALSGRISDA